MPPRHGKSETISRYLPAWYLGRFPDRRVMLTAYEAEFAASWGRKARTLLEEHGEEFFGVRVSARNGRRKRLGARRALRRNGQRRCWWSADRQGRPPADHRRPRQEPRTGPIRTAARQGLGLVALNRPHPPATARRRRARDDPLARGRPRRTAGTRWLRRLDCARAARVRRARRRARATDRARRSVPRLGFDEDFLDATRRELGSYWFSALYQQRPQPVGRDAVQAANSSATGAATPRRSALPP